MGSSITYLVRHFFAHPEHRFILYKRVVMYPKLAEQFEAIQLDASEEAWLQWFSLFERVAPEQTQEIAQDMATLLLVGPDLDAFPPEAEGEPTVVEANQPLFEPLGPVAPSAEDQVRSTNREKKHMAERNSQIVYSAAPGWGKYKLEMKTGEVLPLDGTGELVCPLHCHLIETEDGLAMEEMRLFISEHRILSYHERKWFWQNTSKTQRKLKMDIKDISKVLKADVVDMLLDLVLPGLFLQAADAYLSVSIAPSEAKKEPEAVEDEAPSMYKGPVIGPSGAMARSPFATRPIEPDAETTMVRKAIVEPSAMSMRPKELTVSYSTARSWLGKKLGLQPKLSLLHVLQINETHLIETLGVSITFMIESTPTSVFPWVRIERSGHIIPEADMSLCWNQDQAQSLPPNFKSTGALSRRQDVGELVLTIKTPSHRDQWLTIRWQP